MKITATIITLNEEKKLKECLESVAQIADEIIVVDSGSTDNTELVARRFTEKFIVNPWSGYSEQKNFAAEHSSFDWILSLDADERLSEPLKRSILEVKTNSGSASAYKFPRKTFYMGRWIEHSGWYPDHKIRLYDRREARWDGEPLHESLSVDGEVRILSGDLLHYSIDSLHDHSRVANLYTDLAAKSLMAKNRKAGFIDLLTLPPITFFKSFILQQGFRDGLPGLCVATFAAYYVFQKYAKLWEMQNIKRETPNSNDDDRLKVQ